MRGHYGSKVNNVIHALVMLNRIGNKRNRVGGMLASKGG